MRATFGANAAGLIRSQKRQKGTKLIWVETFRYGMCKVVANSRNRLCRAEEKLGVMRTTFGANAVGLARINSATGDAGDHGNVSSIYCPMYSECLREHVSMSV